MNIEYLRQFRFFDLAIFDFVASFVGVLLLSPVLKRGAAYMHLNISTKHWLWLTLPIGVIAHLLTNRITPLTAAVINPTDHYFLKIILVIMVYMGLKDSSTTKKATKNKPK